MPIENLFTQLWQQYTDITPSALRIHHLLNQPIVNDHVAFRCFAGQGHGLDALAQHFLSLGYKLGGCYHFEAKHLYAQHFMPPRLDLPKVFISELAVENLSPLAQQIIENLLAQTDKHAFKRSDVLYSGRQWQIKYSDYLSLLNESEYAAWLSAWGYRANHFTVFANALGNFESLAKLNAQLRAWGFKLNAQGGFIKGSEAEYLEQSATLADKAEVDFVEGVRRIPGCFYEFAWRHRLDDGQLFQGFVENSADKIFSSTNMRRA